MKYFKIGITYLVVGIVSVAVICSLFLMISVLMIWLWGLI